MNLHHELTPLPTEEGKQEVCAVEDCAPLEDGCEPYYTPGVCCPTCKWVFTDISAIVNLFQYQSKGFVRKL